MKTILILIKIKLIISWINLNFQNPNSINIIKINIFYNFILIILINIIFILILIIKFNLKNKFNNKLILQNQKLEIIWTIIPILIVIIIRIISINLLFSNNEIKNNILNIKTLGNQWFWNYEYPIFNKNFNSYLILNNNFNFYILETDNNIIIPFNYQIILIFSSLDVIHSWTLPSINIKIDCIPNQLNRINFICIKPSTIYGQCSEICGIYHSFIPIKIESIKLNNFLKWI